MDAPVTTIDPQSTILEAFEKSEERKSRALVVTDGGTACGVVTGGEAAKRVVADEGSASANSVREIMTTRIAACYDDTDVMKAREFVAGRNIEHLLVCNRQKKIIGVVSADALNKDDH